MFRVPFLCVTVLTILAGFVAIADDPVFSGPQVGERLPPFMVRGVYADEEGKEFDLVTRANGKPMLLVFVHKRTRPSIGLTMVLMKYAATRAKDGLVSSIVWLNDDMSVTEQYLKRIDYVVGSVPVRISTDGAEGPGNYGLNRNVTLTVLVANENKITANFAIVQPGIAADAPKILAEVVKLIGGKVPPLAELDKQRYKTAANKGRMKRKGSGADKRSENAGKEEQDPNLRPLLAPVIQKSATPEEVKKAAAAVESYIVNNEVARKQVGQIAQRIIRAGRLENYGTPTAQEFLRKWAEKYGPGKKKSGRKLESRL